MAQAERMGGREKSLVSPSPYDKAVPIRLSLCAKDVLVSPSPCDKAVPIRLSPRAQASVPDTHGRLIAPPFMQRRQQ